MHHYTVGGDAPKALQAPRKRAREPVSAQCEFCGESMGIMHACRTNPIEQLQNAWGLPLPETVFSTSAPTDSIVRALLGNAKRGWGA